MNMLDVYSDFLISNQGQASATALSLATENHVKHDTVTRFLKSGMLTEKDLWKMVKKTVRENENRAEGGERDGALVFDDTVVEKLFMDENDIVCYHYDHMKGRTVKGIGLLTAFLWTRKGEGHAPLRIPVGYRVISKTREGVDPTTGRKRRFSEKTKNELMLEMVDMAIRNEVRFRYVVADTWFASKDNMEQIHKKGKSFVFEIQSNRNAALFLGEEKVGDAKDWKTAGEMDLPNGKPVKAWLKELKIPVLLLRRVFENKDGSTGEQILATDDLGLSADDIVCLYKRRWSIEEYHKSLKNNTSIGKSPASSVRAQSNHIFSALFAYVKLERIKMAACLNHFAFKAKIVAKMVALGMEEIACFQKQLKIA
jgi:hypothetical protein